ncbi:hypothetical protein [Pseudoalteromonas luteoviolacea]|uniref:hypothetical protein n=1 Tax=Pseudoalteromonas luteoviolacea TaxID=43657 RepID=UPI001B369824|nr:hypothetical protein [Pseudoalteromonas luteoviolacea]MBQ4836479.1 hypothetical protein [Pseudoalteromonas luteoviolacea]
MKFTLKKKKIKNLSIDAKTARPDMTPLVRGGCGGDRSRDVEHTACCHNPTRDCYPTVSVVWP